MSSVRAENRIKHLVQEPGSKMPFLLLNVGFNIWVFSPGTSLIYIPGHFARAGVNDRYMGPDLKLPKKPLEVSSLLSMEA